LPWTWTNLHRVPLVEAWKVQSKQAVAFFSLAVVGLDR